MGEIYGYDDPEFNSSINRASVTSRGEQIVSDGLFSMRIDEASSSILYVGAARPGTATSATAWRIRRISTSGSSTSIGWADGSVRFDKVWDNRVSYSYS